MPLTSLKNHFLLLAAIVSIALYTMIGTSCSLIRPDKQKMALKKQKAENKKMNAEYDKAVKAHYKNQSKDAKKMMKHTKKKASQQKVNPHETPME